MSDAFTSIRKHFASLEECVEHIGAMLPAGGNGGGLPALLFRGEPCAYRSTLPSLVRVMGSAPRPAVRELLIDLEGDFLLDFEDDFGGSTLGISQHYGLPTDYVEFTSSPTMAACFASRPGADESGVIGVLDVARAMEHCAVVSLSHPRAARPGRQQAYAVRLHCGNLSDYKDPLCCGRIGLAWYSFRKRPADAGSFGGPEAIMDVRSDPVAEWMRGRIRSYRGRGEEPGLEVEKVLCAIEAHV